MTSDCVCIQSCHLIVSGRSLALWATCSGCLWPFHALLTLSSLCSGQAPGDQCQTPLTLRKHRVRALGPRSRRASNKKGPGRNYYLLLLIDKMSSSVLSQQWPRCLLIMLTGNESNKDLRRSDNTTEKTVDWPLGWCQMDSVTNKPLMSCLCFECNAFNLSSPGDNLLPAELLSVTQMSSTGFKNQFGEEMWELTGPDVSVIIVYWQPGGKF